MSTTYSRGSTRQGSVLAARNARTADPTYDDGQSLASRQASHRRNGSQSTITDNGFRFNNDDEIRRPSSVLHATSSGLTSSDRTRSLTLNPQYSSVSLRGGNRRIDENGAFHMHALTSDRAETHSPLSERFGRDQRYLQPQTHSSSQLGNLHNNNTNYNSNDVYELPTQAPSPNNDHIAHQDSRSNHNDNSKSNHRTPSNNTSYDRSAITPLHDLSSSAYPFPPSTTTPTSAPIPISSRTTPTSPLGTSVGGGGAGSYSSTLTQRIMERRMQQARENQTALSSASAYGSSLAAGQIGGSGSLLNGLPSAGGSNGVFGAGGGTGQANTSTTRLSSMSNRSAPRVGLLKPKGYKEGNSGFGGGVTG